ncbi:MAG: hypothetical protein E7307_01515 [Butyrivibrio sp.]|nr:hypothetical protein [Butyrivibrio sp.]
MAEAIEIILCTLGGCVVVAGIGIWIAESVSKAAEEKRRKQKMMDLINKNLQDISDNIAYIKTYLEYK